MAQSTILLLPFEDKKQRCATLGIILLIKISYVKQSLRNHNYEKRKIYYNKRKDYDAESYQGEL